MTEVIRLHKPAVKAKVPWVPTPTGLAIQNILERCQYGPDMGLIIGTPGTGKTSAIRAYKEAQPQHVWIVAMSPTVSSLAQGLMHVCSALDEYPPRQGASAARNTIIDALRWDERDREHIPYLSPPKLIVFDEAQHMGDLLIEEIRLIHDEVGIGIVLCGNSTLPTRFNGKSKVADFMQLTSRIGSRLSIPSPNDEDVAAVCANLSVTDRKMVAYLGERAKTGGGLRTVEKIVGLGIALAATENLALGHLTTAAKMLGVPS